MKLVNKVALVSGGASGIGRAIAQLFLEEGASVVITDINETLLRQTAEEFSSIGPVVAHVGDVGVMADGHAMVQRAIDEFGRLDILMCNAGITSVSPIELLEEDEWDRVMTTNIKGMYTLIKSSIGPMKEQGGGVIITMGSEMGFVAVPESPVYCATKGAVHMFTKSLAVDLITHNIRVNSLCPGITRTPLLQAEVDNSVNPELTRQAQASWAPIMRVADPREIAQGALFLASGDSSFAVGTLLLLDGGFTSR